MLVICTSIAQLPYRLGVMKRTDLIPAALLLPVLGFVAVQATQRSRAATTTTVQAASLANDDHAASQRTEHVFHSTPVVAETPASASLMADAPRNLADERERLALGASGTYIGEILAERDSSLARWQDRITDPIKVWVADGSGIPGWSPTFPAQVRSAFQEWSGLGIPVKFEFVADSASAEVHVDWTDHFDTPISGKTLWARDHAWWIVTANITLALHHNQGEPLDDDAVKAIALHEVGHLLGLDHTADTTNIMTARVRVRDLSNADRATMKLLYTLPPGSVK